MRFFPANLRYLKNLFVPGGLLPLAFLALVLGVHDLARGLALVAVALDLLEHPGPDLLHGHGAASTLNQNQKTLGDILYYVNNPVKLST